MTPEGPDLDAGANEPVGIYGKAFGVGEFPRELNRFSWGAFLLPFFWGLAHRSWPVMTAWVIGTTSPFLITGLLGAGEKSSLVSTLIAAEVLSEIVSGAARLWAGANAYRMLWLRDAFLNELGRAQNRGAVGVFLTRQRTWTLIGAAAMGAVVIGTIPLSAKFWSDYGLSIVGPAMSVTWIVAEVLLGLWLGRQMRAEQPSPEAPRSF